MSLLLLGLLFPIGLLLLMLAMERIERPLTVAAMNEQLEAFLLTAQADEVEAFVSEGYSPALDMYWRNRVRLVQPLLVHRDVRRTKAERPARAGK